ncbi:unnamed protein product [Dicrocoelium dendriticum]|nr:unnamed protein product [Dicrocoelium dendriticum]
MSGKPGGDLRAWRFEIRHNGVRLAENTLTSNSTLDRVILWGVSCGRDNVGLKRGGWGGGGGGGGGGGEGGGGEGGHIP